MSTPESQLITKSIILNPEILIYFKIGCLIIIMLVSLIFGLLPLYYNITKSSKFLGFANAFSGGLFMGIGLFHLLPEAQENFESYYLTPKGQKSVFYNQPLSYFIAFISYSLILFLEKVAFDSHALTAHTHGEEGTHIHHDDINQPLLDDEEELALNKKKVILLKNFLNLKILLTKKIMFIMIALIYINPLLKALKMLKLMETKIIFSLKKKKILMKMKIQLKMF